MMMPKVNVDNHNNLIKFWHDWCDSQGLPHLSADDMIHFDKQRGHIIQLTEVQFIVAQNFYNLWEAAINNNI